jgi:hypothetical protein
MKLFLNIFPTIILIVITYLLTFLSKSDIPNTYILIILLAPLIANLLLMLTQGVFKYFKLAFYSSILYITVIGGLLFSIHNQPIQYDVIGVWDNNIKQNNTDWNLNKFSDKNNLFIFVKNDSYTDPFPIRSGVKQMQIVKKYATLFGHRIDLDVNETILFISETDTIEKYINYNYYYESN